MCHYESSGTFARHPYQKDIMTTLNDWDTVPFTNDLRNFAREFESLIDTLEKSFQDKGTEHAAAMRIHIAEMQELRDPWRFPKGEMEYPTASQVFAPLASVVENLFAGEDPEAEIPTAREFYFRLGNLRSLCGSTWLACSILDMEHKLARTTRAIPTTGNQA
jgi:hypothetical protein